MPGSFANGQNQNPPQQPSSGEEAEARGIFGARIALYTAARRGGMGHQEAIAHVKANP